MFGDTIDYLLLRQSAHSHDRMTEAELDRQAESEPVLDVDFAMSRLDKWNRRLDGHIPLDPDLSYLDVGCGRGSLSLAVAIESGGNVMGIDVLPREIAVASNHARELGLSDRTAFQAINVHDMPNTEKFDVILSHEMIEHVSRPKEFFQKIRQLLKPNGKFVVAFGPLFHSPWGDHLNFFHVPIPWKGVLFSESALMRLRTEFYRPGDPVTRFEDVQMGLNKMRFCEFLRHLQEAGWESEWMYVNPQFKAFPPLYWLSCMVTRIPLIRDYFAASVYAILRCKA